MGTSYRECTVHSATISGADAIPVSVEVVLSNGMPGFSIVGMTDIAIQEARERVRAALRGCGFSMPREKIVVNLAPGFMKKTGSGFDLPIAVGLLIASGQIDGALAENSMYVGELSLDGCVHSVSGMIAYQEFSWRNGCMLVTGPMMAYGEDGQRNTVKVIESLASLRDGMFLAPDVPGKLDHSSPSLDFSDIGGSHQAKRALQIAAAGNHGVLMVGPPGSGKTMLASRLPTILPPLSAAEKLQAARIHSIAGEPVQDILAGIRPFRAPHHSATTAGIAGGGTPIRPGEISLAHNGVLFLDEISEFKPSVLQVLRKPMEDGEVVLSRAQGKVTLPGRFMLVAASNPCPCGYFGDREGKCTCGATQVSQYQNRLGGPLVDRIDMRLDVWRSDFESVVLGDDGMSSKALREGVMAGRRFAFERWKKSKLAIAPKTVRQMIEACCMSNETQRFLEGMSKMHSMSGRGIMSILRLSRTIADIEQSFKVTEEHVSEALCLRFRDGG